MSKPSRKTSAVLAFMAIVAAGYGITEYWRLRNNLPQAFMDAQAKGAIIAQSIVATSQQSSATLNQVNQDDRQGNDQAALALVANLLTESENLRNQAVQLSNQVEAMTQSLSDINSLPARQAALDAISSHLALINQLINYSGDLGNLSDALQRRFSQGSYAETSVQIQALVNQVNVDVAAINNFNNQAAAAMQQFNSIVNK